MIENFSASRQKLFGEVVITAFSMSRGTYWGKRENGFCERSINFLPFSESARKVAVGWSTLHLPRQRDLYADHFLNYMIFYCSCKLSENFSDFRQKLFGEVAITAIFVSIGTYGRNTKNGFSEKKYRFFIILGDCKENFGGVVNTTFTETIGSLCRSFFWFICFFNVFVHWEKTFRPFVRDSPAKV